MIGYKYTTEQKAINSRKECADFYGLPKTPDSITKYYVDYSTAELDTPVFWYIQHDVSIEPILGQPTEFNITQEDLQ